MFSMFDDDDDKTPNTTNGQQQSNNASIDNYCPLNVRWSLLFALCAIVSPQRSQPMPSPNTIWDATLTFDANQIAVNSELKREK